MGSARALSKYWVNFIIFFWITNLKTSYRWLNLSFVAICSNVVVVVCCKFSSFLRRVIIPPPLQMLAGVPLHYFQLYNYLKRSYYYTTTHNNHSQKSKTHWKCLWKLKMHKDGRLDWFLGKFAVHKALNGIFRYVFLPTPYMINPKKVHKIAKNTTFEKFGLTRLSLLGAEWMLRR